jgi:hypothetical protein
MEEITYVLGTKYYKDHRIKEGGMGGVRGGMRVRDEKCVGYVLARKPKRKELLGRLRKWKDNIKINFKERGWEGVE